MSLKSKIIAELHSPARRNFPRRATVLKGINDLYQSDLIQIEKYSKLNKGYRFILILINCFSKMVYAIPIKRKTAADVTKAMRTLVDVNKLRFKHLQTDDGTEYFNKKFKLLMNEYKINHYSTKSEKKAAIAERAVKSLKSIIYKQFSQRGKYVWYDVLQNVVRKYNSSYHRTIGAKPIDVKKSNELIIRKRIAKNTKPREEKMKPKRFKEGDHVRISKYKQIFRKGYLPNWTNEVFEVYRVQPTTPETYLLKDKTNKLILGSFYGHELLKSFTGNVYLVEKILKQSKNKALVRWLGFDKSQDSWVSKKDLL